MLLPTAGQLLVLGLAACATAQEVKCWAPDGKTQADNETYVPCNKLGIQQTGVFSMCCALDGKAEDRDICSASGLCTDRQNRLTRAYCTDENWKSKACINVCTDENDGGNSTGPSVMTACNDGSGKYCCGNSPSCCGTAKAVSIPLFQDSVCRASDNSEEDAAALSTWRSASIGLAAALGVTLLAALASTVWMARQNKSLKKKLAARPDTTAGDMQQTTQHGHTPSVGHTAQFQHPHYTGSTQQHQSPMPEHGHMYKPSTPGYGGASPPPMHSPHGDSWGGNQNVHRYSELDAAATVRSEMASPPPDADHVRGGSPRPDSYVHSSPMHSPGLPRS